jgi:cellobiose-specific phosphotransferase system component IIA
MRAEQAVSEMAEEVLARQAKAMLAKTGQSFESALEAVSRTEAGQQLRALANGEHRREKAHDWQVSMPRERAEGRLMHLNASDALSRIATTKLGPCQVRSKTERPCPHRAVMEIRGIPFCEACAREQEAYFAIGKLTMQAQEEASDRELVRRIAEAGKH